MVTKQVVVGALLVDSLSAPTRVLAARRTSPPALAGRWEFPGGKVKPGESPEIALERELMEELSIAVDLGHELVSPLGGAWKISEWMELRLWFATPIGTVVLAGSHDETRWAGIDNLFDIDWLDSDRAALPYIFG